MLSHDLANLAATCRAHARRVDVVFYSVYFARLAGALADLVDQARALEGFAVRGSPPILRLDSGGMKRELTFSELRRANRARCEAADGFNHKINSWSLSDWMTAACGELGEAANIIKKLNRYRDDLRGNKMSRAELQAKLMMEIADTVIYLDLLCQRAGIDLDEAVITAFDEKSDEIGWPHPLGRRAEIEETDGN
jgi:NTP pyrophosphatase (non-canonical NTP hydrolase)